MKGISGSCACGDAHSNKHLESRNRVKSKTITFTVPCYNSAAYMDTCITSLLACDDGAGDIEIIIVDDGSTKDDTADKADAWAARHPETIRVIHKENGGHGSAVNAGMRAAQGMYFKVVDSDDWLDEEAAKHVIAYLRKQRERETPTDLIVTNYVYERIYENKRKVMSNRNTYPEGKEITWAGLGKFNRYQYLHMHAVTYRTQLLKDIGLELPEHCFYVDNIYVYVPLPHVKSIIFFDVDLYRYFIGREGQSVTVEAMLDRIDQHIRVTRAMIERVHLPEDAPDEKLYLYMTNHMAMMVCVCAIFLRWRNTSEDDAKLREVWDHLHYTSPDLFRRVQRHPLVVGSNIPTPLGRTLGLLGYRIAQRMFGFN